MGALHRPQRRLLQGRPELSGAVSADRRGPRYRGQPLGACALVGAIATVAAIVVRLVTPFEHGIWLVAYLLLVGTVAPYLLAAGQQRLGVAVDRRSVAEAGAWLAAVVLVPAGVLLDARLLVVAGGSALLACLASLAHRSLPGARRRLAHAAIIAFMAASTFVGIALAWDRPWL